MMPHEDDRPAFYAKDGVAWRKWLAENHESEKFIWLIMFKKDSGISTVNIGEAIDEALCFGWVDSKVNRRNSESYYTYFSKRNPKSNWSRVNKNKIQRLLEAGKMEAAGLKMIEIAKASGTWTALDDVENLIIPDDLGVELDKYANARRHFQSFPRSVKRSILEWIFNAKRPPTRAKRIHETASLAEKNERANQYTSK